MPINSEKIDRKAKNFGVIIFLCVGQAGASTKLCSTENVFALKMCSDKQYKRISSESAFVFLHEKMRDLSFSTNEFFHLGFECAI